MAWSTCPPDVLAKCFKSQQDYVDNSAAACVCKPWRDTFRACAEQIKIQQNPLNEALLSPTYLRQFEGLHTVDLGLGPGRPQQSVAGSWLRDAADTQQNKWADVHRWTQTMQSIPPACCWLRLDGFFPSVPHPVGAFSQLSNLSSLHIYSHQHCNVFLEDFAHLPQLQSLSLVGHILRSISIHSSLCRLPAGITNLQFKDCHKQEAYGLHRFCLQDLSHMCELRMLDMSNCHISFQVGEDSEVANLQNIKVLVLDGAEARGSASVVASLMTATQLEELSLRNFRIAIVLLHEAQLGPVLASLSSLQRLDITHCCHVFLGPSEYTQLRLHSFACDYSQLNIVEAVPFKAFSEPFQTREGTTVWPKLQIAGQFPHFGYQHWIDTLPMAALTNLTIHNAHVWPLPLFLDSKGQALPNLHFLSVSFASLVSSCPSISIPVGSKVQELYVAGTQYDVVDLEGCNSLTRLGIIQAGYELPGSVALPKSLERLGLYNVLKAETEVPELHRMTNLSHVKLGGRATTQSIMKHLPRLPPSLLELDLWDGVTTELDRLTLLTRLKKLRMPSPPSPQQLSIIKQLRQLRHIEVTTHAGMYTTRGKVVAPWNWERASH